MDYKKVFAAVLHQKPRSCWSKGVKTYALMLLDNFNAEDFQPVSNSKELQALLLNGAKDWSVYSWSGSGLIYDESIAKTLCTKKELVKTQYGALPPNRSEQWLDVQARALYQAYIVIRDAANLPYMP